MGTSCCATYRWREGELGLPAPDGVHRFWIGRHGESARVLPVSLLLRTGRRCCADSTLVIVRQDNMLGVMKNPWLDIPLADYEGHMALPNVGQAQLLSDVFAGALSKYAPRSVAVLGCAGGNGLDRISSKVTERVVGVDLNPDYVLHARTRFKHRLPLLELLVGDVQTAEFAFAPVEMVFAGLLLEYVDAEAVLARIRAMLCPGGTLLTVVQLPRTGIAEITPSPFASLGALAPLMRLVPPALLRQLAAAHGYRETEAQTVEAAGGKAFRVQAFRLETPDYRLLPTPARGGGEAGRCASGDFDG